ncbi:hypothetical protein O9K51_09394 [Purpureocillium lavendulum]|uniref:Uncharacterized protein n=1 Tax=Purpureocillium lavendulum TaxID=1247861 RepID=A0AB34FHJ3_9HYPO|nr:hypothetical protein O9K51_09394 [Purpureocillium lavendulum]
MAVHLITKISVRCGHIDSVGYEKCNHSRKCSEENRFESHVELKLEECRKCEGDKMLRIHFNHVSDIQSLERYWTTRHLLKIKNTHGPFEISMKGVTDLAEGLPWREIWQNNIVRLISEAKNGATTVYMNGLVVPIHELDDRVEDFVEEVIRKALNDAV